jgi:hypothetical protein
MGDPFRRIIKFLSPVLGPVVTPREVPAWNGLYSVLLGARVLATHAGEERAE